MRPWLDVSSASRPFRASGRLPGPVGGYGARQPARAGSGAGVGAPPRAVAGGGGGGQLAAGWTWARARAGRRGRNGHGRGLEARGPVPRGGRAGVHGAEHGGFYRSRQLHRGLTPEPASPKRRRRASRDGILASSREGLGRGGGSARDTILASSRGRWGHVISFSPVGGLPRPGGGNGAVLGGQPAGSPPTGRGTPDTGARGARRGRGVAGGAGGGQRPTETRHPGGRWQARPGPSTNRSGRAGQPYTPRYITRAQSQHRREVRPYGEIYIYVSTCVYISTHPGGPMSTLGLPIYPAPPSGRRCINRPSIPPVHRGRARDRAARRTGGHVTRS